MLSFNNSEDKWLVCLGPLLPLVTNVLLSRERRETTRSVLPKTSTQGEAEVFACCGSLERISMSSPGEDLGQRYLELAMVSE